MSNDSDGNHDNDDSGRRPSSTERAEISAAHAVYAYGSGVRTTLRNNATAYGFSITITVAFGLVTTTHPKHSFAVAAVLFAAGALFAFLLTDIAASRVFRRAASPQTVNALMVSGAVDAVSVACAVGAAVGLAQLPGLAAWPLTAFGATLAYLLVGGFDVLLIRRLARAQGAE